MPRGGARPNAGRKKGSASTATRKRMEVAQKALEDGITPLEVMLNVMRMAWGAGDNKLALDAAKDAAPYVHSKMATFDVTLSGDPEGAPIQVSTIQLIPLKK